LDRHPACQFTYFARAPVDPALEAHPRARRQQPMAWPEYRRWLARQRFHLALYPLLDNGFDRARSASKLAEHAVAGAVGVYPAGWAPGAALAAAGGALLAPDRVELWPAAMDRLIGQIMQKHHKLAQIAAQAAKTLSINDPCAKQRQIWSNSLDLCLA
ncbi:MAG TPA: hypothetical protein VFF94_14810, partial [Novosphingobium sp.]|nr:hypothetical protein [Novosphingobium sp.]